jgi:hypothetical protein
MTPHGIDITDSTYVWGLANSISTFGYAEWILHPLSFFGLYPLSYPSAVPTILSIISQVLGLDIEYVILLFGFVLGILGMFGAFIELTRWTATTRSLFVALLPLFIWTLLCYHNNKNQSRWKYLLLALILLVILGSTHRMFLLMPLVIGAYFVAMGVRIINNQINSDNLLSKHKVTEKIVFPISIMLFVCAFLIQFSGIHFYKGIWWQYQTGAFFEAASPLILILNMSVNYIGSIGILILFGLFGLLSLLRKRNKNFCELFVLVALLFLTPTSALGLYVSLFILPFASVLITMGLLESIRIVERSVTTGKLRDKAIKNNENAKTKVIGFSIIAISLIVSTCFSMYMVNRHMHLPVGETGDTRWMNDGTYNTGLFLKNEGEDKLFLSNDVLIAGRIRAVSGVSSFSGDIYGLISGFIRDAELETRPIKLADIRASMDYIYYLVSRPNIDQEVRRIYNYDCDDSRSKQITSKYGIEYVVMNNHIIGKKTGWWYKTYPSKYMMSIYKNETRVYDNNLESVWYYREE